MHDIFRQSFGDEALFFVSIKCGFFVDAGKKRDLFAYLKKNLYICTLFQFAGV
jgi:hypothetical protein